MFIVRTTKHEYIEGDNTMSVARITEISATSKKSFEDAVKQGVKRASETLQGITSAWVADQEVTVKDGEIAEYRVRLKITFILKSSKK
jgi:flavin-binding protein dodecin